MDAVQSVQQIEKRNSNKMKDTFIYSEFFTIFDNYQLQTPPFLIFYLI